MTVDDITEVEGIVVAGDIAVAAADGRVQGAWGMELTLDLSGCEPGTIASRDDLVRLAGELCEVIKMRAYGEPFAERFALEDPDACGFTLVRLMLVQLIETSSISGHFSERLGTAYINIFSCRWFDATATTEFVKRFFSAKNVKPRVQLRGQGDTT